LPRLKTVGVKPGIRGKWRGTNMSGGSYNYLCGKDQGSIIDYQDELEKMSNRLAGLGYAVDAAKETEELILIIRQFLNRAGARIDRLSAVWKAVEWWDSWDWGEEKQGV
jgi:hypothetical protein